MDAKFQPSFMPKQPLSSAPRVTTNVSILYVAATIIFVITLGLVAAVFLGERSLKKDIETLNIELVNAKNSFELGTITFLKDVSSRTGIANELLNRHVATSKFFEALEDATFANVSFSKLSADITDDQNMTVSLDGMAASYNTLILQKNLLSDIPFLTQAEFSNFSLDNSGRVGFSFQGSIEQRVIDYKFHLLEQ